METKIPTRTVGSIHLISDDFIGDIDVPLATFEKPVWHSVNRGARVTAKSGGIKSTLVKEEMTRSIILEAEDANSANKFVTSLKDHRANLEEIVSKSSRFAKLKDYQVQIVANLIYLRFSFATGGAAGHNMTTKAAEMLQSWLLEKHPGLKYVSISGNYCTDKKNSAVNGILGRGKYVIAEAIITRDLCEKELRATPEKIIDLNIKKNLIGSIISGGVRTANSHFANMLLAFYLATGQDAANIIEGSQGFTHAKLKGGDLYFSVTLPNIIVGVIGAGKDLDTVQNNLNLIKCLKDGEHDYNTRMLAMLAAAVTLCGELSLMAAQTNQGELMRSHIAIER